jgi:hypothetical protein
MRLALLFLPAALTLLASDSRPLPPATLPDSATIPDQP